jgi:hypothetical protein
MWLSEIDYTTDLLLAEIIWKVGNHDFGLGWDTVGGRAALTALTWDTGSLVLGVLVLVLGAVGAVGAWLVGGFRKRKDLASRESSLSSSAFLMRLLKKS